MVSNLRQPHSKCPGQRLLILQPHRLWLSTNEVSKLLEKGAVTQTPHTQGEFLSNIFLVPKKTGHMRPVINLKPLNRHVCKKKFKMETIRFAVQLINEGDYMASIDLKALTLASLFTLMTANTCDSCGAITYWSLFACLSGIPLLPALSLRC